MQQLLSILDFKVYRGITYDPPEFVCFSRFEWLPSLVSSYCPEKILIIKYSNYFGDL